ncbi:MAG: hypothetical protein JWN76_1841 [Chitinophagaceae bacterium]|nr:hypothetical protein [Chitinophagaceae bacterium]
MSNEKIIREYKAEDIAESLVLPVRLSPAQKKQADQMLAEARLKAKAKRSQKTQTELLLMQLYLQMKDYIKSDEFDKNKRFGHFLKAYVRIAGRRNNQLAKEIGVHHTVFSLYINNERLPQENIAVRLEEPSNKHIPADVWYMIAEKEKIHFVKTDKALRQKEKKHVKVKLFV